MKTTPLLRPIRVAYFALNSLFFFTFYLAFPAAHVAQQRIHIDKSCSFNNTLSEDDLYGFDSDENAEAALKRIMKHTGLPAKFKIMAANVPNAAAVIHGEERFILYNQEFMRRVKDVTRTDWAAVSILAHEVGHHLSGHTLDKIGSRPDKELEADKFSGFVLRKMGATLEQAKAAMANIASDAGSHTHPPKSARLTAIANGWYSADEIMDKDDSPSNTDNNPPPRPTTRPIILKPLTNRAASSAFNNIWVEHNQSKDGQMGMMIHVSFNVNNLQGQNCALNVWFNYKNGSKLMDFNGLYKSTDGQVSIFSSFTPGYENTSYNDFQVFMPYDELHMQRGRHDLKFNMGIFQGTQRIGSESAFTDFWFKKD